MEVPLLSADGFTELGSSGSIVSQNNNNKTAAEFQSPFFLRCDHEIEMDQFELLRGTFVRREPDN